MVLEVMRRLALSICIVMLLFSLAAETTDARTNARTVQCPLRRAEPLLSDAQAAIYLELNGPGFDGELFAYGCVYGHKRTYSLGHYD